MNRKREQAEMFFMLGQLFGPLLSLCKNPSSFDADEKTRIIARYAHDSLAAGEKLREYSSGEPGHNYYNQFSSIYNVLHILRTRQDADTTLRDAESHITLAFELLASIPVPVDSAIHEAQSPFATCSIVRDLCSTCRKEITWLDRYFGHSIFHRHLSDIPANTVITLVTYPQAKCSGNKDIQRYNEFLDISRMFAQERGPAGYRLLVEGAFHDRLLRCDDKLFSLGGSIKDIGKSASFTVSRLDSTPQNFQRIDDVKNAATELFGPNHPVHP